MFVFVFPNLPKPSQMPLQTDAVRARTSGQRDFLHCSERSTRCNPPLLTDTEANNCFSIYNTSLIFADEMGFARHFFLRKPPGGEYDLIVRD